MPAPRAGLYDSCVTYIVQHGSPDRPAEHPAESVAAAARLAVAFVREQRRNVRVRLPDGATLDFEAFQDAVFQGVLRD